MLFSSVASALPRVSPPSDEKAATVQRLEIEGSGAPPPKSTSFPALCEGHIGAGKEVLFSSVASALLRM